MVVSDEKYLGPYNHPINKREDKPKILVSSWDFGPSYPQAERADYPKSTNPAKMRPSLVRAILQIYGEAPVLDPMAGSFTTCIEASKLGLESYGVEFEKKFIKEVMKWKIPKGCAPIHFIKGDARELSKIFRRDKFGNILMSPPYWSALHNTKEERERMKSREVSAEKGPCGYSENPENIANIPTYSAGSFGTIVFSPPYWNAVGRDSQKPYIRSGERIEEYENRRGMDRTVDFRAHRGYGTNPGNIGNIPDYGENMFGSVIFSPPYYVALSDTAKSRKSEHRHLMINQEKGITRQAYSNSTENIGNIPNYGDVFGCIVFSPPYFDAVQAVSPGHQGPEGGHLERQHLMAKLGRSGYGSCDNIGHIQRYGENIFGSIVFSPPYSEGIGHPAGRNASSNYPWRLRFQRGMTEVWSEGNIARLRHGSDANIFGSIVFSPPYAGNLMAKKNTKSFMTKEERLRWASGEPLEKRGMNYSQDPENIGNVSDYGENLFGSVVFSPPFGEATRGGGIAKKGYEGKYGKDVELKERCDRPFSENPNNIGNMLYGKTYLSEMRKVYAECFKVLKPGKFMVVVVKNFRRNKQEIDLEGDTVRLCQKAGFILWQKVIHVLNSAGFWQINHVKKTPSLLLNMAEYVLVFRKPFGNLYIREQR